MSIRSWSNPRVPFRYLRIRRLLTGWISQATICDNERTRARPKGSAGKSFGPGLVSSRPSTSRSASGESALRAALAAARAEPGPHLIHTRVGISTDAELGRPAIAPPDVAARFRDEIANRRQLP